MRLVLIAAICEANNIIGCNGMMPWVLPEDLKRFRQITTNNSIVMGRKTWEFDLKGKPLANRRNIVLSTQPCVTHSAIFAKSIEEATAMAEGGGESLFVIGGAETYRQFLPMVERLELTWVDGVHQGDTFFPATQDEIAKGFNLISSQYREGFRFSSYTRR